MSHMAVDLMGSASQGTALSPCSGREIPKGALQAYPTHGDPTSPLGNV